MKNPRDFENWNPAWRGAFNKGRKAAANGEPESACPYEDKRKDCGRLTWSRAFIAAWRDGWRWQREQDAHRAITEYYTDGGGRTPPPFRR